MTSRSVHYYYYYNVAKCATGKYIHINFEYYLETSSIWGMRERRWLMVSGVVSGGENAAVQLN